MIFIENQRAITSKDTEVKFASGSGKAIATTRVYTTEEYNDNKTYHNFNLIMFGQVAEDFANEVEKGCLIEIVKGVLCENVWTGNNGQKHYDTNIKVLEYALVENYNETNNGQHQPKSKTSPKQNQRQTRSKTNSTPRQQKQAR